MFSRGRFGAEKPKLSMSAIPSLFLGSVSASSTVSEKLGLLHLPISEDFYRLEIVVLKQLLRIC